MSARRLETVTTDHPAEDRDPNPPTADEAERIALHRAVAVVTPDSIAVRPPRGGLLGPLIQAVIAGLAAWALVSFLATWPLWVLGVLLVFMMIAGPTAVLGIVYNLLGSSVLMERRKGTVRWQQGFLGLGIGTHELVPFARIDRIEVSGDFEDELGSGDLQDVVTWEVRLVKDNGRLLQIGQIAAARPLADEALDRANAVARAFAEMSGVEAREGTLPSWFYLDDEEIDELLDDPDED